MYTYHVFFVHNSDLVVKAPAWDSYLGLSAFRCDPSNHGEEVSLEVVGISWADAMASGALCCQPKLFLFLRCRSAVLATVMPFLSGPDGKNKTQVSAQN